jgi:alpha-glucosidase
VSTKRIICLIVFAQIIAFARAASFLIGSPDGRLKVTVSDNVTFSYNVTLGNDTVVYSSPLGIYRDDYTYPREDKITKASDVTSGKSSFTTNKGKKAVVNDDYNEREFYVDGSGYSVVFRVYNDGVAFAYRLSGNGTVTVIGENSGFRFAPDSRAWLSQLAKAKSGWAKTNPSYEDHYHADVPIAELSDHRQGWIYPALVKTGKYWSLITESATDNKYAATHLSEAIDNTFMVDFPHADQNMRYDPSFVKTPAGFILPWRIVIISDKISDIVQSTIVDDVATPVATSESIFTPGKASWSWLVMNDTYTTPEGTRQFIDMAADLHFQYCLIDAAWDRQIGRDGIVKLVKYAAERNVKLILWYNSLGKWNEAYCTPMNLMNSKNVREKEMQWLKDIGIAGIKVDFFGGDKQNAMALYEDILRDACKYGIMVDFHGCTVPRGWSRMYPAFMTAEAVRGQEFCKGEQANEDERPHHCAILPFTRNVVSGMDFTPVVLRPFLGEDGKSGSRRSTTTAFELALPIIFHSPLTHFGLTPTDIAKQPEAVKDYFRQLPTQWDDIKLLYGTPGHDVVIARLSNGKWWIAGINGENKEKTINVDLSTFGMSRKAVIITTQSDTQNVDVKPLGKNHNKTLQINLKGNDGFVIKD